MKALSTLPGSPAIILRGQVTTESCAHTVGASKPVWFRVSSVRQPMAVAESLPGGRARWDEQSLPSMTAGDGGHRTTSSSVDWIRKRSSHGSVSHPERLGSFLVGTENVSVRSKQGEGWTGPRNRRG